MEPVPFPFFSRNRFFTGKLLDESDLTEEQDYVLGKDRLLNRTLHGWGVVSGLDVALGDGDSEIVIGPGLAIDGWGREIVVSTSLRLTIPPGTGGTGNIAERHGDGVTIRIRYEESDADPMPLTGEETQTFGTIVEGHVVWTEPGLPSPPPDPGAAALPNDPSVVLATVRRSSNPSRLHIDTTTHRHELPSNAALLEMVQHLEARITRLLAERHPTDP